MIRSWTRVAIAYGSAAIIQGIMASRLPAALVPDLCLVVIVFLGLRADVLQGILISAAFGIVSDCLFTQTPGLNMGGYPLMFFAVRFAARYFFAQSTLAKALLVLSAGFFIKLYHVVVLWTAAIEVHPTALVLTAVIAPWIISKLDSWILPHEA